MGGPGLMIVLVATFGVIAIFVPVYVLFQGQVAVRSRLRQRCLSLAELGRRFGDEAGKDAAAKTRQKLIQGKLKELEKKRATNRHNSLQGMILQSGLELPIPVYIVISVFSGIIMGLVLFFLFKMSLYVSLAGVAFGGLILPRKFLRSVIKKRQTAFIQSFGDALDILVRGTRTGLPIGECLRIAGREVPDPVGFEFRMLVEGQRIGMSLEQALDRALERVPITELQFFAIVLMIQQQTGGNLASTLDNLSNVLRSRRRLKDKISALSSEAKASAMIIGSLPFCVGSLIYLINPEFIGVLFTTQIGNYLIMGGLSWMFLGVIVMREMINFKM